MLSCKLFFVDFSQLHSYTGKKHYIHKIQKNQQKIICIMLICKLFFVHFRNYDSKTPYLWEKKKINKK